MRLLFVVQRYGEEVAGGAEALCRSFAERLHQRGVDVDVVTSRAVNYVGWDDHYPEGAGELNGVQVTRLSVSRPRQDRLFGPLHDRVMATGGTVPLHLQEAWMRMQGPTLDGLAPWLEERAAAYDAVVFFTYLYFPAWAGLGPAAAATTAVLHPFAHDEPTLRLPLFDIVFRIPHGIGYLTEEERHLVEGRFHLRQPSVVTGVGIDLEGDAADTDGSRFRQTHALGDDPYLLFVGRIDPQKGTLELADHFAAYKARNPGPLKLVLLGDPVRPLPPQDDVVVTGFVADEVKRDAIAGCTALVNPSYFESFSIVLCESWAQRKPAIVQGRSAVLDGMARRSGGALPYAGFPAFEAAVDLLLADSGARTRLGDAGRAYVERHYSWDAVLDSYEHFLSRLVDRTHVR